jgi:hypothetical protein
MKNVALLILILAIEGYSQEPNVQWSGSIGGLGYDTLLAMKIDANDNLYITACKSNRRLLE